MGDPGKSLQVLQGTGPAALGWQQGVLSRTKLQVGPSLHSALHQIDVDGRSG